MQPDRGAIVQYAARIGAGLAYLTIKGIRASQMRQEAGDTSPISIHICAAWALRKVPVDSARCAVSILPARIVFGRSSSFARLSPSHLHFSAKLAASAETEHLQAPPSHLCRLRS